jgi:hypothetical protein
MSEVPSDIKELVLGSEREVESKILIARLFRNLGFDDNDRAENYSVEWYECRKKAKPKFADQVYFNGTDRTMDASLVVAEAKRPDEGVDAQGQAVFYSMWLRVPFYVLCNGTELVITQMSILSQDKELLRCKVIDIPKYWAKIETILHKQNVIAYCNENKLKPVKIGEVDVRHYLASKVQQTQSMRSGFVPLDAYEYSRDDRFSIRQAPQANAEEQSKPKPLLDIVNAHKHIVLLGEPGAGKTTSLQFLLNHYSLKAQNDSSCLVPIFIPLHRLTSDTDLIKRIKEEFEPHVSYISLEIIRGMLQKGRFCLLLDALDEVQEDCLTRVIDQIKKFMDDYSKNKVILTCRADSYRYQFKNISVTVRLNMLSEEKIRSLIQKLAPNLESRQTVYRLQRDMQELIRNPLLLYIIIDLLKTPGSKLPRNRALLLENFSLKLLEQWELEKGLSSNKKIGTGIKLQALMEIATANFPAIPLYDKSHVVKVIAKSLPGYDAEDLLEQLIYSGILQWSYGRIQFYHPLFQQYFIAAALVKKCDSGDSRSVFGAFINDFRYRQVLIFAAGLFHTLEKREEFLDLLLDASISLYQKCLESQSDLSEVLKAKYKNKELSKYYFSTLHRSYDNLIAQYFYPFTLNIDPWSCIKYYRRWIGQDIDQIKTGIAGLLAMGHTYAAYAYKIMPKSDTNEIELIKPPLRSDQRDDMSKSRGRNLRFGGLGIDSSRQISFDDVMGELREAIDKKRLIEDGIVLYERVADLIKGMKVWSTVYDGFKQLALGKSSKELIDILTKAGKMHPDTQYHVPIELSKTELVSPLNLAHSIKRLYTMGYKTIDPLLPEHDKVVFPGAAHVDNYTDERLKSRVISFFQAVMQGYMQMVEVNFPKLKTGFPLYSQYPVKCVCVVQRPKGRQKDRFSLKYLFVPVAEMKDTYNVELHFDEIYDLYSVFDNLVDISKKLGRSTQNYSMSMPHTDLRIVIGQTPRTRVIGNLVYDLIAQDLAVLIEIF